MKARTWSREPQSRLENHICTAMSQAGSSGKLAIERGIFLTTGSTVSSFSSGVRMSSSSLDNVT